MHARLATKPAFRTDADGFAEPADARLVALREENARLRETIAELEAFRTMAHKDALTGMWNRRYFDERLADELERARRSNGVLSVLFVDVNDLKRCNDSRGHAAGDQLLREVTAFLRSALRGYDVCCRIGGDEFAVILPGAGVAGCAAIVERIYLGLARENAGRAHPMGLSVGSATFPNDANTVEEILERADRSMYVAKQAQKRRPQPLGATS